MYFDPSLYDINDVELEDGDTKTIKTIHTKKQTEENNT
jgi:hypothetical protein